MNKHSNILLAAAFAWSVSLPAMAAQTDTVVYRFTAFGDKGWHAIIRNQTMSPKTSPNGHYPRLRVKRSAYAKGVEFSGRTTHGETVLNIRNVRCRNQGKNYEFTATLYHRGKVFKGCAVRGAYGRAPT